MQSSVNTYQSIFYSLPDDLGVVEFPVEVLEYFAKYQQKRIETKEAGGQLFWTYISERHWKVALVTGPRTSDRRARNQYKANHREEQKEIDECYEKSLYFLGDWHTHPELIPIPSASDKKAIKDIYKTSRNRGAGFLMVIVGISNFPEGLSVNWCNDNIESLKPIRAV